MNLLYLLMYHCIYCIYVLYLLLYLMYLRMRVVYLFTNVVQVHCIICLRWKCIARNLNCADLECAEVEREEVERADKCTTHSFQSKIHTSLALLSHSVKLENITISRCNAMSFCSIAAVPCNVDLQVSLYDIYSNQFMSSTLYQRCDRVYTKLVDIVYRVSCIVYTRTYTKFYKYTKIHTRNF